MARAGRPEPGSLAVVVLGDGRRKAVPGAGEVRAIEHGLARHEQGFHDDARILEPTGELHPLGGQIHAQPEVGANGVPLPDPQHEREQLLRLAGALAQLARPAENGTDLGCGITARSDVGGAQRAQQLQLLPVALRGLGQGREKSQAPVEVTDRLDLRGVAPATATPALSQ